MKHLFEATRGIREVVDIHARNEIRLRRRLRILRWTLIALALILTR
jgi:hypothetical protein